MAMFDGTIFKIELIRQFQKLLIVFDSKKDSFKNL